MRRACIASALSPRVAAGEVVTRHLLGGGRGRSACRCPASMRAPCSAPKAIGGRCRPPAVTRPGARAAEPGALLGQGLGGQLFTDYLRRHPRRRGALFRNDDYLAGALLEALRTGVKVPEHQRVAGFGNDLEGSECTVPRPHHGARTPRAEIGRRAATMLVRMMRGRRCRSHPWMGFELVCRESGGAPHRHLESLKKFPDGPCGPKVRR